MNIYKCINKNININLCILTKKRYFLGIFNTSLKSKFFKYNISYNISWVW